MSKMLVTYDTTSRKVFTYFVLLGNSDYVGVLVVNSEKLIYIFHSKCPSKNITKRVKDLLVGSNTYNIHDFPCEEEDDIISICFAYARAKLALWVCNAYGHRAITSSWYKYEQSQILSKTNLYKLTCIVFMDRDDDLQVYDK